jgi:hypothetical protein
LPIRSFEKNWQGKIKGFLLKGILPYKVGYP